MTETPSRPDVSAPRDPQVQFGDVVKFIRQLSHDLRNHLNAAELQAAYLKEVATDPEVKEEVQRLRAILSEAGKALQQLSASVTPVKLSQLPYPADAFMEDLQQKVALELGEQADAFRWQIELSDTPLETDPQHLQQALLELLQNALRHERGEGPITIAAASDESTLTISVREPKTSFHGSTEEWGAQPLARVGQGHYGLGLHRARNIIEAHGGALQARYDSDAGALVTTVSLPLTRSTQ